MLVNIPFSPSAEKSQPLKACIQAAAQKTGFTDFHVALVMSHFFEELCEQVSQGRPVVIHGFGCFTATVWKKKRKQDARTQVLPGFAGSRSFKNQTDLCLSPERAREAQEYLLRYRRNHHLGSTSSSCASRPFTAQQAFRDRLAAQMKKLGIEFDPYD